MNNLIFKNYISVNIEDEVAYPVRFSPKQLDFYSNYNENIRMRSLCTAGILMEFNTSERIVAFSCKTNNFIRSFCSFDIYENDVFETSYTYKGTPDSVDISYERKTSGTSKITVYLPYTCRTGIYNFNIEAEPTEYERGLKILACGDSITHNMLTEYPSMSYTSIMARHFDALLLNHGVGGKVFCKDTLDDALDYEPNIITVAYGTNDLNKYADLDEIVHNAYEYMSLMRAIYKTADIYLISPIWREQFFGDVNKKDRFFSLSNALENLCGKFDVNFINGFNLVPGMADFFADGTHPNAKGFLIYALNLIKHIKPPIVNLCNTPNRNIEKDVII